MSTKVERQARPGADEQARRKLVDAVKELAWQMETAAYGEGGINALRIRGPQDVGDDYLLVVARDNGDGKPEVGFSSSATLEAGVLGLANRLKNGTMQWHPDKYAGKD